jgi:hypothetical protein
MDGEAFQDWIQWVVWPYVELHNNSLYLLLDQFSVHMQHNNTFQLQQIGIEVDFIPAGYTPVLQVLDKRVYKPLKHRIHGQSSRGNQAYSIGHRPLDKRVMGSSAALHHSQHLAFHWHPSIP